MCVKSYMHPKAPTIKSSLRPRLLLLLLPESKKTDTSNLDDLESDTRNITLSLSSSTETGDKDLVVLVGEVQTTVVGDESGDLLAVLDELNSDTLSDSRVGLLGLNADLLQNDTLSVGRATSGGGLVELAESSLLVVLVGPSVLPSRGTELSSGLQTPRLVATHCG